MRKIFSVCPENFFEMNPPPLRRQHLREKNVRCPFLLEKCPSKPAPPPQLLEASYAPERIFFVLWRKIAEIRISEISKNCSFNHSNSELNQATFLSTGTSSGNWYNYFWRHLKDHCLQRAEWLAFSIIRAATSVYILPDQKGVVKVVADGDFSLAINISFPKKERVIFRHINFH